MIREESILVSVCLLTLLACSNAGMRNNAGTPTSNDPVKMSAEGYEFYRAGAYEQAIDRWHETAKIYKETGDSFRQSDALMALGQGYLALGYSSKAAQNLELAMALTKPSENPARVGRISGALGQVYLQMGQFESADQNFGEALRAARDRGDNGQIALILNSLGNLRVAQGQDVNALESYRASAESAQAAQLAEVAGTAWLNVGRTEQRLGHAAEARRAIDQAFPIIRSWLPSHDKAGSLTTMALIEVALADSLVPSDREAGQQAAVRLLEESAAVAKVIEDSRAASYAYGFWGQVYEKQRRYEDALRMTRLAVAAAQRTHAPESLYRWQWQTGRLMKQRGDLDEAIKAYRRAAATLQSIRPELLAEGKDRQVVFREAGGQVFFQLADVLLEKAKSLDDPKAVQGHLSDARDAIELFKAAELRDYFKDNCVDALVSRITSLEQVSQRAAVLYPIILPDRTELLLSFSDVIMRYTVPVTAEVMTAEIRAFRMLVEKRTTRQYLPHAQRLYDWLIRPLEASLSARAVETLVVVPDGALRTIPIAALHDGKQYLVARYAVATTPGLNLTDPRPLKRERRRVFAAGLTEGVQGFSPLPNVHMELEALQSIYASKPLIDQQFLVKNIEKHMQEGEFSIVHIATHGQFASRIEDTFLLTFDDKLTMDRLSQIIGLFRYRDEPLELLTLSACETAAGNDRAALGLAGVAIKAGARSALATLWFINDQASSLLVAEFYRQLQDPSISKAVALQRAQLELIQKPAYQHPGYWAPFLLLNNWL